MAGMAGMAGAAGMAGVVAGFMLVAGAGRPAVGAADPVASLLLDDLASAGLATVPDGSLIACVDGATGAIVVPDDSAPRGRRAVVPAATRPRPEAVAWLDPRTLAAVGREDDEWSLQTWRVEAGDTAAAAVQTIPLGRAHGPAAGIGLVVGRGQRWIVVSGLPPPLEPIQRGVIVGGRIGPLSGRRCPRLAAGVEPAAVTVGPRDELVIVERRPDPTVGDAVSFHATSGECLLRLDTRLTGIRGITSGFGDEGLWVVTGGSPAGGTSVAGLWRLDAALEAGRQVIAPRLVLPLEDPRAVVWVPESAATGPSLAVIHDAAAGRRLVRIDAGARAP